MCEDSLTDIAHAGEGQTGKAQLLEIASGGGAQLGDHVDAHQSGQGLGGEVAGNQVVIQIALGQPRAEHIQYGRRDKDQQCAQDLCAAPAQRLPEQCQSPSAEQASAAEGVGSCRGIVAHERSALASSSRLTCWACHRRQ